MNDFINKTILYKNRIPITIFIFIILLLIINYIKPNFIYNKDGTFMELGVGFSNKTILPIWIVITFLALFSYISFMYFINKLY